MRKRTKIGVALALAVALAIPGQAAFADERGVAGGSEATESSARSVYDSDYWFQLYLNGATAATEGRTKDGPTSAYIRVDKKTMDFCKVYIDGSDDKVNWSNQVSYWTGSAVGNSATVDSLGEFLIMNRVNENGYIYARLTAWAENSNNTGELRGVWSPDSIGDFKIIND